MAVPPVSSVDALGRMRSQKRRDTAAEIAVRRELHSRGLRYRVDVAPIPNLRRRADIVFSRSRIAVFIDGCYWHGCPDHATRPKANAAWWAAKLDANFARDRDTDQHLSSGGWLVIRAWEHEDPWKVANQIEEAIHQRSRGGGGGSERTIPALSRS
jgi:DNA mismatch endonuclease (patch repair protein)